MKGAHGYMEAQQEAGDHLDISGWGRKRDTSEKNYGNQNSEDARRKLETPNNKK